MTIEELKSLQSNIIKKNKKYDLIGRIIIGILIVISVFVILIGKIKLYFGLTIIFIELIFSMIILTIIKSAVNGEDIKTFYKVFKNIFVLKSLQHFFGNIDYKPEEGFSEEYIETIGMLDTGDRYYSNDYISGSYKNIKFEQSDIHIEEKHEEEDDDGNKREVWETTFMGRLMVFDFNKNFKANIQVVSLGFNANTLPWGKNFCRVKMEDIEFNKRFVVFAENEHEAFYILTPHFMEKLKETVQKLNCGIMFAFVDNRLHIAINNGEDSFEYNVFKPINEQEIEENITKDIKIITDFIDELDLDNNLFKKK